METVRLPHTAKPVPRAETRRLRRMAIARYRELVRSGYYFPASWRVKS